jgi:hypothetical protein
MHKILETVEVYQTLMNSRVKFIRRQVDEVAHRLAKAAPLIASFHIYINIPTCNFAII